MFCLIDKYGFHRFESLEEAQYYVLLRDFTGFAGDVVVTDNGLRITTTAERPSDLIRTKEPIATVGFGRTSKSTSTTWPQ